MDGYGGLIMNRQSSQRFKQRSQQRAGRRRNWLMIEFPEKSHVRWNPMPNTRLPMLLGALLLTSCATSVPVAISCPPPPPIPQVLVEPVSIEPSLAQRYEILIQALRDSLTKAIR